MQNKITIIKSVALAGIKKVCKKIGFNNLLFVDQQQMVAEENIRLLTRYWRTAHFTTCSDSVIKYSTCNVITLNNFHNYATEIVKNIVEDIILSNKKIIIFGEDSKNINYILDRLQFVNIEYTVLN
jgi:hypothetical protein